MRPSSYFSIRAGTPDERYLSGDETKSVLSSIYEELSRDGVSYKHNWTPGDFIISDNLALGHEATPETQSSRDKVGLRVMHRVTVKGKVAPKK